MPIKFKKEEEQQHTLHRIVAKEAEENAKKIAEETGFPYIDLTFKPIQQDVAQIIPEQKARGAGIAVISKREDTLSIVAQNPDNRATSEAIRDLKTRFRNIAIFVGSQFSLEKAWAAYMENTNKKISGQIDVSKETFQQFRQTVTSIEKLQQKIKEVSSQRDVSVVLELLLASAVSLRASDIHIEPEQRAIHLRMRVDGIMYDISQFGPHVYRLLLSRVKLLSGMKLNIHSSSQDGRFTISFEDTETQVRSSVLPGEFGENIVMRLLDPKSLLSIKELGLNPDLIALVDEELKRPNGMIIVCGPTGSGKTTTLYAFLKKLLSPKVKIITIEDPVEYRLGGISQTQVSPDKGYTFATGLRSILRQDPDIILVGEIRDLETVDIALQAALTGHLVFATLHANDAAGTIPRMTDIGASITTIGPALNMSIAQRLLRKVCESCRTTRKIRPGELLKFKKELEVNEKAAEEHPYLKKMLVALVPDLQIPVVNGCDKCNNSGYKGRVGIFEIILIDEKLERFLLDTNPSVIEIQEFAISRGMTTLKQDGFFKVIEGLTTIEEVERITG